MSSYNNGTANFDNLLMQTLMGRLQIRPQNPLLPQSLEDLLFDPAITSHLSSDDDNDDDSKTQLAKEESKLEKEIIRIILSGNIQSLKPNSGQAVTIGEHHICVGFHEETGSDYRVWEWHGHIMLFDEENGYTPEYIYGNYFERVPVKAAAKVGGEEKDEKVGNMGLRELIESGDSGSSRIIHRNMNSGSPRLSAGWGGSKLAFSWLVYVFFFFFFFPFSLFVFLFAFLWMLIELVGSAYCSF
eukprot:XP_019077351.1 PREDICTED: uncharacterized protein LOC100253357 isoform X1 [Vitis vinifera]